MDRKRHTKFEQDQKQTFVVCGATPQPNLCGCGVLSSTDTPNLQVSTSFTFFPPHLLVYLGVCPAPLWST